MNNRSSVARWLVTNALQIAALSPMYLLGGMLGVTGWRAILLFSVAGVVYAVWAAVPAWLDREWPPNT